MAEQPKITYLNDYKPSDYLINHVVLHIDITEAITTVTSILDIKRRDNVSKDVPLVLDGEKLTLKSIALNEKNLDKSAYQIDQETLTIPNLPKNFTLKTVVEIKPQENMALSGLYKSRDIYCTQCESHGFRRITYFLDRPDVITRFTTIITADKKRYPVLLSNGNLIEQKDLDNNRHWVKWEDPSLKPCYLFALVAGDLEHIEDEFITMSGRKITLRLYTETDFIDQCDHAMSSLKRAMRWDEEAFGREYELDIYMIVAISDFNMGAMENKGLNIFNTKYILSKPTLATDKDFIAIEKVVGHEYFHNWSGNRVTCRDWFQITLKEGLTVFRDQCFTADMHSKDVKRIEDVNIIRSAQFSQDAGPMAHPIQPDSYVEVNNFYTVTVYNKGAEVIRMLQTLLGPKQFRKAMDLYFEQHEGQAVTTEEFVKAMEDASDIDLKQFRRWYKQAGTPCLTVESTYNESDKTYTLKVKQSCPPTPGQAKKEDFHIPFSIGLLDAQGKNIPLRLVKKNDSAKKTYVLNIQKAEETFTFDNVPHKPIPSLLRCFSAPVKVHYTYTDDELAFLMENDSDAFGRWNASQYLAIKVMLALITDYQVGRELQLKQNFMTIYEKVLNDSSANKSFLALMLTLPSVAYLMECVSEIDIDAICTVREFVRTKLAESLCDQWLAHYKANITAAPYHFDAESIAKRDFKNLCLSYLTKLYKEETVKLCIKQFQEADNMTDQIAALSCLNDLDCKERQEALDNFFNQWEKQPLVINKWFALQAGSKLPGTLENVKALIKHAAFNFKNPNNVHSLMVGFTSNPIHFHDVSGNGYTFLANQVMKVDTFNPQMAAKIVEPLTCWQRFDKKRQNLMKIELNRIRKNEGLSKDVYELVEKGLSYS